MSLISTNQTNPILPTIVFGEDGKVFTCNYEAYPAFQYWGSDSGAGITEIELDITNSSPSNEQVIKAFNKLAKYYGKEVELTVDVDFQMSVIDEFIEMVNKAGGKGYLINASCDYVARLAFLPIEMAGEIFEM